MGTSRGYSAPTTGSWPPLKRQATQFGGGGGNQPLIPPGDGPPGPSPPTSPFLSPQNLLGHYVRTLSESGQAGGSGSGGGHSGRTHTQGGSQGSTARAQGVSRAAIRVGRNLGSFVTSVAQSGLANTLREFGLGNLVGRPAKEVTIALIDRLAGPGTTMDESLARIALNRIRQELFATAKTAEDLERVLTQTLEQLEVVGLVMRFYSHYLFERFCRDFYERLVLKVGSEQTRRSIDEIRRTIFASLRAKVAGRNPTEVDWGGSEGHQLAERILEETLHIFEVGI